MRGRHLAFCFFPVLLALHGCRGDEPPVVDVASGLLTRPSPRGCQGFDVRPGEARSRRVYPALSFEGPVQLVRHPSKPWWLVVEQRGTIRRFEDRSDAHHSDVVLDLRGIAGGAGYEDGLLGLAFDPDFDTTGRVILKYTTPADDPTRVRLVVATARSRDGGATIGPDTVEELLSIERPAEAMHHGGPPAYGRDGFLYVPVGDGGWETSWLAQDVSSLAGKILRIDPSVSPYAIPPGNPYATVQGARPEIFASGFRNPHGWSFDPDSAELWVGDVGLHSYEELNRVSAGDNLGWPIREGAHCRDDLPCEASGLVDPVHEYVNLGGGAIVGGPVYLGSRLPWLRGHVVFGDFVSGQIGHLPRTGDAGAGPLVDSGKNVTSFTLAPDGELLFTEHVGGIWTIEPNVGGRSVPARLSETGCVDVDRPAEPPPGLIPYDVAMPLWSDGTEKQRWMAVPDGTQIHIADDGAFEMPTGSVLVKSFFSRERPIETRLLVRHADGEWGGYTYEWTDDGRDAVLLENGKVKEVNGTPYTFPSRAQCLACHTPAAGFTLGLETAQLNHTVVYDHRLRANQIATLDHIELFDEPLGSPALLARFPQRDDARADPEEWARAYLHSNCSHCHRPGGPGMGNADLRFSSPLAETGCGGAPFEVLGADEPRVIVPGNPDASIMIARLQGDTAMRMPPLATWVVDTLAIERIRGWIAGIDSCAPR